MRGESVKRIIDIESRAEKIIDEARVSALNTAKGIEENKKQLLGDLEDKMRSRREETLKAATAQARSEAESIEKEARTEIEQVTSNAKTRSDKAASLILSKVLKKLCL